MTTTTFTAAEIGIAFPTLGQAMKTLLIEQFILIEEPGLYALATFRNDGSGHRVLAGSFDLYLAYLRTLQSAAPPREGA